MKFKYALPVVLTALFAENIYAEQIIVDFATPMISTTSSPVKVRDMEQGSSRMRLSSTVTGPADEEIIYQDWAYVQKTLKQVPQIPFAEEVLGLVGFKIPVATGKWIAAVLLAPTLNEAFDALGEQALATFAAGAAGFIPSIPTTGLEDLVAKKATSSTLGKTAGNLLQNFWDKFKTKASAFLAKSTIRTQAKGLWDNVKDTMKGVVRTAVKASAPFYVTAKKWFA